MESFFRYIAYVDYYKNGERISNVGFLKWRFFHKEHEVEIKINGLPKIKKNCSIKEIGSGKEIGILFLEQGMGYFKKVFSIRQASGEDYIEIENERLYLRDIVGFKAEIDLEEMLKVEVNLKKEFNYNVSNKNLENDKNSKYKEVYVNDLKEEESEVKYNKYNFEEKT